MNYGGAENSAGLSVRWVGDQVLLVHGCNSASGRNGSTGGWDGCNWVVRLVHWQVRWVHLVGAAGAGGMCMDARVHT